MRTSTLDSRARNARTELTLLLLASLGCAVALTAGFADAGSASLGLLAVRHLILVMLVAGAVCIALVLVWQATRSAHKAIARAQQDSAELRRSLVTAESILKAEPQVLIYWERGRGLKVIAHSLTSIAGLPTQQQQLLRFGHWLEPQSASELKQGLDGLFEHGRPFNMMLRTGQGGHLEADGRTAGGSAVLRLRDLTGAKSDLARLIDENRTLVREGRAMRALIDALPMPVWIRGAEGRIQWVNAAFVKSVEAQGAEEVYARQIELLEQRQRQSVEQQVASGKRVAQRLNLIVGGQRKAHDLVVVPVDDVTAAAAIDVAEIESARGELERQISAYDRTLDRVATAVAIFNREQRLSFFNDAFAKLWQLDTSWLNTGPSDGDLLDRLRELGRLPEVVNYREWKTKLIERSRSGAEQEDWWHLPDGRVLHVMAEQRPDGGITYLYGDETERLALESRYNAMIDVQSETLDALKEGVAVFGTDGRLKLFNSSFAGVWRLSRRALGEHPHIDEIIQQTRVLFDEDGTWSRISRAVTSFSDHRESLEGQMIRPDGSVVDFTVLPLPDGATLLTFLDVTASKRYERALLERNEALVASDRLKNQFIGRVSYELRTPLTNIIGFSELLSSPRTGELNSKQRDYLGDIRSSSKTLLSIIDDILDLATIDAGAMELKLSVVDVRTIIDAAVMGVRERAMRARLTIDIAIADEADSFVADEARMRQVLYNLLSNAVGFSKLEDTVRISCWCEASEIIFTVEDQGVGIPRDQMSKVFERFESSSHGSKHRGAGLGLSIVRSLVELHGGAMTLDSEPGRGTKVTVRMPKGGLSRLGVPLAQIESAAPVATRA
jgi:signal transduction histidine kinase